MKTCHTMLLVDNQTTEKKIKHCLESTDLSLDFINACEDNSISDQADIIITDRHNTLQKIKDKYRGEVVYLSKRQPWFFAEKVPLDIHVLPQTFENDQLSTLIADIFSAASVESLTVEVMEQKFMALFDQIERLKKIADTPMEDYSKYEKIFSSYETPEYHISSPKITH